MARILVIEDNPANLELMSYLLRFGGHDVAIAQDGEEGVAQAATMQADIIVCDVHLPRLDGYGVAQRLKADDVLCSVPLVAVTALAMVGDKDKVLHAGFDGYITKPIDPREFVAQVESFLPSGTAKTATAQRVPNAAGAATVSVSRAQAPDAQAACGLHILVVDDSCTNGELARATLEPFGYRVTVVTRATEALELLALEPCDLILSDMQMPGSTGLSLLNTVKSTPQLRRLPFILISSSLWGTRERERGLAMGASRFLVRPISPERLLREVAACLVAAKES